MFHGWLDCSGRQEGRGCTQVDVVVEEANLQVGQSKDSKQFGWNCQRMLLYDRVDLGEEVLEPLVELELHGSGGEESEAAGNDCDLVNINFINLEVQGHQVIKNCASVEDISEQKFSSKFCCSSGGDNPHLYVQVSIEGYVLVSFAACELPDFLEVEVNIAGLVRTVVASDSKKEFV